MERVKSLVQAGTQPEANIFDAEATLANDEQNLTVAENSSTLALLSLSQTLQVSFDGFDVEIIDLDAPSELLMYSDVRPILNYAFENTIISVVFMTFARKPAVNFHILIAGNFIKLLH